MPGGDAQKTAASDGLGTGSCVATGLHSRSSCVPRAPEALEDHVSGGSPDRPQLHKSGGSVLFSTSKHAISVGREVAGTHRTCFGSRLRGKPVASIRHMRERTIAFFEVVNAAAGEHVRMAQMDWQAAMALLTTASLEERMVAKESTLVGTTVTVDAQDHLLLHRVKDPAEWLSVMDWTTGQWQELEQNASRGFVDTSAVCFLPFGNIVGLMPGSVSAPSHKGLETWLNELRLFPEARFTIRPVLSRAEVERLSTAHGASRIEIKIGGHRISALGERNGRLARFLRTAHESYGDIDVTMIISVPRGQARDAHRQALLDDLRDIAPVAPAATARARARLVYAEADGPERSRLVELTEHHITAKRRVPAVDEHGNSIRILSAVDAILDVAADHESELRAAVEAGQN